MTRMTPDALPTTGLRQLSSTRSLIPVLLFMVVSVISLQCQAKIIHEEKSLYRNIAVKQTGNKRCLVFPSGRKDREQSCMDVSQPDKLIFPYVRMTFAGLMVNPNPSRILVVGLGGGSIPVTLAKIYPESQIVVVEIDSAVVKVAEDYFGFKKTERITVSIVDARVFIKRAALKGEQFDYIILDAFNGDYIPEHLMTAEFLGEVRSLMTPTGVLVANTFSTSSLYDHESVTYHQVFGDFVNFKLPVTGNRIILASKSPLPDALTIKKRVKTLQSSLSPFGINIEKYPRYMHTEPDWDQEAKPLTDQYSPANLLQ